MTASKFTKPTLFDLVALRELSTWKPRSAKAKVTMRPVIPATVAFRGAELAVATYKQQVYIGTAAVVNREGVAIHANQQLAGAIGVSGSPDGQIDESCANLGVKAAEQLLR